jgi:hypothetical protein
MLVLPLRECNRAVITTVMDRVLGPYLRGGGAKAFNFSALSQVRYDTDKQYSVHSISCELCTTVIHWLLGSNDAVTAL